MEVAETSVSRSNLAVGGATAAFGLPENRPAANERRRFAFVARRIVKDPRGLWAPPSLRARRLGLRVRENGIRGVRED